MYNEGVDVIFVAAGESGRGVLEAATELSRPDRPLWVIGVDTDQFYDITDEQRASPLDVDVQTNRSRCRRGGCRLRRRHTRGPECDDRDVGRRSRRLHRDRRSSPPGDGRRARDVQSSDHRRHDRRRADTCRRVADCRSRDPRRELRTGESTRLPLGLAGGSDYAASADGTKIARATCCSPNDVVTIGNIDGSGLRTLKSPAGYTTYAPQWTPTAPS